MTERHDREQWISELAATPGRLRTLLERLPPGSIARKPSPETFSARENVHHLRDLEVEGWTVRLDRLLHEEGPELSDIDGDALARARGYNDRPHEEGLAELASRRAENVAKLRAVREEDWKRSGRLAAAGGHVTIERLVEIWLEHDRGHLNDVASLCAGGAPDSRARPTDSSVPGSASRIESRDARPAR